MKYVAQFVARKAMEILEYSGDVEVYRKVEKSL